MFAIVSFIYIVSVVGLTGDEIAFNPNSQSVPRLVINTQSCPMNLLALREDIESLLRSVSNEPFKAIIRKSLKASIPEAIQQADGINPQMAFLRKEIAEQDQIRKHAEETARESTDNREGMLAPCSPEEKGSYCSAVEQYYISSAINVANRGFLAALECYKRNGVQ